MECLDLHQFVVCALLNDFALRESRHCNYATQHSHGSCALSHSDGGGGAEEGTFMKDDDAVGILDGREAVSNDHDGTLQYLAMLLPRHKPCPFSLSSRTKEHLCCRDSLYRRMSY